MGEFIDGAWKTNWYEPDARGEFNRPPTKFRARVTADGASGFRAEEGRYHLFVSYACPWAHRTIITRAWRGLEDAIGMTVVDPKMGERGWTFAENEPNPLFSSTYLADVYL